MVKAHLIFSVPTHSVISAYAAALLMLLVLHTCRRRPVEVPICATVLFSMIVTNRDVSRTSVICLLKRSTR